MKLTNKKEILEEGQCFVDQRALCINTRTLGMYSVT